VSDRLRTFSKYSALILFVELRNTIYVYCEIPPGKETLTRRAPSKNGDGYRTYFHLCHVNSQICQEVLPLYYKDFYHHIPFADLNAYVDTFLVPYEDYNISGRLMLNIRKADESRPCVNIAPLLEFRSRNPYFDVEVCLLLEHRLSFPTEMLSIPEPFNLVKCLGQQASLDRTFRLLAIYPRARNVYDSVDVGWSNYYNSGAVQEIWITRTSPYHFKVTLIMRSESAEHWMRGPSDFNYSPKVRAQYERDFKGWMERVRYPRGASHEKPTVRVADTA
jgi:hypothetical protein